jgi:hypothetical protein
MSDEQTDSSTLECIKNHVLEAGQRKHDLLVALVPFDENHSLLLAGSVLKGPKQCSRRDSSDMTHFFSY